MPIVMSHTRFVVLARAGTPNPCSKDEIVHSRDATFFRRQHWSLQESWCMPDLEIVDLLKEARSMRSLARRIRRLAHTQPDKKNRLKSDADALEQQAAVLETRATEIRQPALF
jgi:hypothetical protein